MITITKVAIIEEESLVNAIYIHDECDDFSLFIDENKRIRTKVHDFTYISETPIIKI